MSHEWLQQAALKKLERRSCPASCKNNDSPTGHKTTFFIPISFNAKCSNDISRLNLWCRQVSVDISWESPCLGAGTDGCQWSWAALKTSCSMRARAEYNLDHVGNKTKWERISLLNVRFPQTEINKNNLSTEHHAPPRQMITSLHQLLLERASVSQDN